jgi:hypothetical protein
MCDYSLHHVSSRPAKVADKLVTTELVKPGIRGFAAVGELGAKLVIHDSPPGVAVCLLPGTELAFDDDVQYDRAFSFLGKARVKHKVASFRQIELDDPHVHHDALEFPNGQVLKITQLVAGQTATVLQLPVVTHPEPIETRFVARSSDSRLVMNRVSVGLGMASILMPSQGTVMLWQALLQSFRRLTARKQHLRTALPAGVDDERIEASLSKGVTATLPKKPATQKPGKKIKAAA